MEYFVKELPYYARRGLLDEYVISCESKVACKFKRFAPPPTHLSNVSTRGKGRLGLLVYGVDFWSPGKRLVGL